ncbi:DUF503 domain-containing protein [bacterium]|nr:DUF503 domain-containing protein [candidate division CSSED10-310 bacterium]
MPVGVCYIEFNIHGAASLKDKRRVVKSIKDRLKARFNISIAEMDHLDIWQKSELGFTCISNDRAYLDGLMASVIRQIESDGRVVVSEIRTEVI